MTADTTPERQVYTQPMSKLRGDYLEAIAYRGFADLYAAEWDRALAAHDAEVARKALTDAADAYKSGQLTGVFMGRDDYAREWLRARAEQIGENRG